MPISSLIVRTKKNETNQVADSLKNLNGAEVSEIKDDNIIVITDTQKQSEDKALWESIETTPGVLQCDLIFHNFEDEEGFRYDR